MNTTTTQPSQAHHNTDSAEVPSTPPETDPKAGGNGMGEHESFDWHAELFGASVYAYSRAQAIADGALLDVTATAAGAGFRTSVAMTHAVWIDCVEWTEDDSKRQLAQDEASRLWDVLWMCIQTARVAKVEGSFFFMLFRVPRGGTSVTPELVRLKACIGPGDAGEPVITILQPNED